jgi:long-chain fatty acid transport protein
MKLTRVFALMALAGLATGAQATNGYFSHGYGMKAKGMGGAATATASDAFGGANNPASMAFVGNRIDLGADLFSPRREMSRAGATAVPGSVESDSDYFVIPEFGYNRMVNSNLALGVTVYGNGGMNSDYAAGKFDCTPFGGGPGQNALCGVGRLGVDLLQLVIAPTAAYKIAPGHSIGISPLLGYQRFKAEGLQAFGGISTAPANLTNRGYDDAFGYGVRIGYQGKITSTVTIGAAYASKMNFDKLDKYKGLFAEQGNFDIPENYNLGVAWQASPEVLVALDYQRITYSGVPSITNSSQQPGCPGTGCLGGSTGIGFGWGDVDVWKLGAEYKYSNALTLRAGYNHGDNPIQSRDVTFNILAPGVVQDHVTLGFTYAMASGDELTMSYMHAFENSVTGAPNPTYFPAGGTETIKMYQNSLGVAYSWKM